MEMCQLDESKLIRRPETRQKVRRMAMIQRAVAGVLAAKKRAAAVQRVPDGRHAARSLSCAASARRILLLPLLARFIELRCSPAMLDTLACHWLTLVRRPPVPPSHREP